MAEDFDILKRVRAKIHDPETVVRFNHFPDLSSLPEVPPRQTACRTDDNGNWYVYSEDEKKYVPVDVKISDDTLNEIVSQYGEREGVLRCLSVILAGLLERSQITSMGTGSDSVGFTGIQQSIAFYEKLIQVYTDENNRINKTSSGRVIFTPPPEV